MIGMQAKIGWEGKNWWVTKLNKLESHRCHTLLGSELCGAGKVLHKKRLVNDNKAEGAIKLTYTLTDLVPLVH